MDNSKTQLRFRDEILMGIPKELPAPKSRIAELNHAPKRKQILSLEEKNWP